MKIDFAHARGEARSQEPGPGAGGIRRGGGGGQESQETLGQIV